MPVSVRHGAHLGGQIPNRRNENAHFCQGTSSHLFPALVHLTISFLFNLLLFLVGILGAAQSRDGARRRRLGELICLLR